MNTSNGGTMRVWAALKAIGRTLFAVSLLFLTTIVAWDLAHGAIGLLRERGHFGGDGNTIAFWGKTILLGVGTIAVGAILSFWQNILGSLTNLWKYVIVAKKLDIPKETITLFFTILAIAVPIAIQRGPGKQPTPEPAPEPTPAIEWKVAYLSKRPDASPLFVLPFTFEPARVSEKFEKLPTSRKGDDDPFIGQGVELDSVQRERLLQVIEALKPCAGLGPDEQVRLEVIGFSSSKNFKGYSIDVSNDLNLRAANARAEHVAGLLRKARKDASIPELALKIATDSHTNIDEMARERGFNDRPLGSSEENPAQIFTRAAWVKLLSVGNCTLAESEIP